MNKNFIIILFVILSIGILVYNYKKKELFEDNVVRVVPPANIDFGPYYYFNNPTGLLLRELYRYVSNEDNSVKYIGPTLTAKDFNTNNYQSYCVKFLSGRDQINSWVNNTVLPEFRDIMYYTLRTNYLLQINGPVTYFETIIYKKDDTEFFKIVFSNNPYNSHNLKITNNISGTPEIKQYNFNQLQSIEINITTVKIQTNATTNPFKLENNINIVINGDTANYINFKLPDGLENHFLNNFKNLTYTCRNETSGVNVTFIPGFMALLYGGKIPPPILSQRTTSFKTLVGQIGRSDQAWMRGGNFFIKRPNKIEDYLPVGDYYDNRLVDALLLKKDPNYVIGVESANRKWTNEGASGTNKNILTYANNNRTKVLDVITNIKTKENRPVQFLSLGDLLIVNSQWSSWGGATINIGENNSEHVLIREDCLEEIPSGASLLYTDKGSHADLDLSIWTYCYNNDNHIGFPGVNLANFVIGYEGSDFNRQYPNNIRKKRVKQDCMEWKFLDEKYPGTGNLIKTDLDVFFADVSNFVDIPKNIKENFVVGVRGSSGYEYFGDMTSYTALLKGNQSVDAVTNPIEPIYKSASQRRVDATTNKVNQSSSAFESTITRNQKMDQIQTDNNQMYSYLSDVNRQLSEIRAQEKQLVNNELNQLSSGVTSTDSLGNLVSKNNETSVSVDRSLNQLGQNIAGQVGDYSVQTQNQKLFRVINPQVVVS